MRDPRYDILFEPVQIGPVTARNRFYQVPHCCGMGSRYANTQAAMRGMKGEGGWAVVSTEEAEIHPSSEVAPYNENRVWDGRDVDRLKHWTQSVKQHGALAAVELCHSGINAPNHFSREIPMGPSARPIDLMEPVHARAMDKADIKAFRKMHVDAALRSKKAGFDIVYVYAGHDMTTLMHFLSHTRNDRSDEYGGSLDNRMRYPLEIFSAMRQAWPQHKPMSVRISAHDWVGEAGITPADAVEIAQQFANAGADIIDVSAGQTSTEADPVYGRMFQTPFSDQIRNEAGLSTMAVGNIYEADHVNSILMAGRADLVCIGRPHLADPYWTLHTATSLGDRAADWPLPYLPGRDQAWRLADREAETGGNV